jgi:hypothetical protein
LHSFVHAEIPHGPSVNTHSPTSFAARLPNMGPREESCLPMEVPVKWIENSANATKFRELLIQSFHGSKNISFLNVFSLQRFNRILRTLRLILRIVS